MEENKSYSELINMRFKALGVDCPIELAAQWGTQEQLTGRDYDLLISLLDKVKALRDSNRCRLVTTMSRLPQTCPKTFDNFDITRMSTANNGMFEHLKSLSFMDAGMNVVIIGDPGTGKTHIAQAIGNLCCDRLFTTRYYKMVEIRENIKKAIERGKAASLMDTLSAVSCLIIDEVGYCDPLNESESNLFFQILDRRYDKRKGTTVFTSNTKPSEWRALFSNASVAKCALDRVMDRCIAIDIRGTSYRGQQKSVYKISTNSAPEITGINL